MNSPEFTLSLIGTIMIDRICYGEGIRMTDRALDILIVSDSRLLVDGLKKILESEDRINVASDSSELEEIKAFMDHNEPDFILLDQRVLNKEIEKYLRSKKVSTKTTQIILLSDEDVHEDRPGSFTKISHNTSARELIELITDGDRFREKIKRTKELSEEKALYMTKTESRIINLITSGHSNKEIAEKLKVSEKTIKAHITNIFSKLNIQNRYQLMVYGQKHTGRV